MNRWAIVIRPTGWKKFHATENSGEPLNLLPFENSGI
jgi:hypothetical protein